MHDVMACGIIREATDSDGYQQVRVVSCIHGKSVTAVLTPSWAPPAAAVPLGPVAKIGRRVVWTEERTALLAQRWNAGDAVAAICRDFKVRPGTLDHQVSRMRKDGIEMRSRRGAGGARTPSLLAKEAHSLTAAGSFKRTQFA